MDKPKLHCTAARYGNQVILTIGQTASLLTVAIWLEDEAQISQLVDALVTAANQLKTDKESENAQ